jgi:hypothetical protein
MRRTRDTTLISAVYTEPILYFPTEKNEGASEIENKINEIIEKPFMTENRLSLKDFNNILDYLRKQQDTFRKQLAQSKNLRDIVLFNNYEKWELWNEIKTLNGLHKRERKICHKEYGSKDLPLSPEEKYIYYRRMASYDINPKYELYQNKVLFNKSGHPYERKYHNFRIVKIMLNDLVSRKDRIIEFHQRYLERFRNQQKVIMNTGTPSMLRSKVNFEILFQKYTIVNITKFYWTWVALQEVFEENNKELL